MQGALRCCGALIPCTPSCSRRFAPRPQGLGLAIVPVMASTAADLDPAFATMAKERYDGLVVLADPRLTARIPDLAAAARLRAIYELRIANFGGLLGYGPNLPELWRRAAVYVAQPCLQLAQMKS